MRRPREMRSSEAGEVAPVPGPGQVGGERGRDRHREQPVGELEEDEGELVGGQVAVAGPGQVVDDDQRDLVGDDVADGPRRQAPAPCAPPDGATPGRKCSRTLARHERGHEGEGHHRDAGRRPEPEGRHQPAESSGRRSRLGLAARASGPTATNTAMTTTLFSTGAHAGAKNRSAGVEQRRAERHQPVEEDLREQEPGQDRCRRRAAAPRRPTASGLQA